jgi:hypothetical protein
MKNIKTSLSILFISILSILSCKMDRKNNTKLLSNKLYDSVVVYIYDGFTGQSVVDSNNILDSTVVTQLRLSDSQENELMSLLTKKRVLKDSLSYEEALCCFPHHGIVFYKNQKPNKWISICFDCNCIYSTIDTEITPSLLVDFFTRLHLKVGQKELIPKHFGIFDPNEGIREINRKRFGKTYDSLRHGL